MNVIMFITKIFIANFVGFLLFSLSTKALAEQITLENLVSEVKVALLKVEQKRESEKLPPLTKIELELNTIQKIEGNGKISFLVVEVAANPSQQITNTVKLTLKPPPADSGSDVKAVKLADLLAESILAGARAIAVAEIGLPPLLTEELTSAVKFALIREGGGKLSIKFPPFKVGGGLSISSSDVQLITVTYRYDKK